MKILAIETTATTGGVALLSDETVLGEEIFELKGRASQELIPAIERLLLAARVESETLDALAVAVGPGSFTGIRVGIATAQGIAQAQDLPVYGISSLRALAETAPIHRDHVAIGRSAREGETYFCLYQIDGTSWSESIPEGRYPDAQITAFMAEIPDVPLLRDGKDVQASPIAVARVALCQDPASSWSRGEGLQARHYSVGFRQSPVST